MSLELSPSIVHDGLVMYYDMANTQKSFKGAPATNLIVTSTSVFPSIYNFAGAVGVVTSNYTTAPDGTNTAQLLSVTGTGTGTQFYAQLAPASPAGTVFTFSFYTKASSQSGWVFGAPGINTSTIGATTVTTTDGVWYRWARVFTTTAVNGVTGVMAQVSINNSLVVWGAQLELGSYATPYIPTTVGAASRSTTQVLTDLTGNHSATATSLTYAEGDTFSFNGSTDNITIANNTILDNQTVTVAAWIKPGALTQNGFIFEKGAVNTQYALFQEGANIVWRTKNANDVPYNNLSVTTASYLSTSSWAYIVGTYITGSKKLYINGALVNSNTASGALATNASGSKIGSYNSGAYFFNGSIGVVQVYNRTLDNTEIKQNFNAMKSRYGL